MLCSLIDLRRIKIRSILRRGGYYEFYQHTPRISNILCLPATTSITRDILLATKTSDRTNYQERPTSTKSTRSILCQFSVSNSLLNTVLTALSRPDITYHSFLFSVLPS